MSQKWCGMHAPRRRCASVATATGVGRDDICNYQDLSWRFQILEAKQEAKAQIRYQFDDYIRALISLVVRQQLESATKEKELSYH